MENYNKKHKKQTFSSKHHGYISIPFQSLSSDESAGDELFVENYELDNFQALKDNLNHVKSKLNNYAIEEWSLHTKRRNPAGNIVWKLKNHIKAEFVTQAWCKFYEILNQYSIVNGPKLNSVHLCEAPGAFIAALNHFLHTNYDNVEWNWTASTLNPYYEGNPLNKMIVDDRFLIYTLDKWIFGKDFTGNIIDKKNIEEMSEQVKNVLLAQQNCNGFSTNEIEVNLVTADGSIDCMESPDCQEEVVFTLHYSEICCALKLLSNGGNFVLKMFTLCESSTISLMYLLNCIFKEVNVFKPATSKCGNSEVYVICLNFNKNALITKDINFLQYLMDNIANCHSNKLRTIFSLKCIPKDFLEQHEDCCKLFMNYQIKTIESNVKNYEIQTNYDMKFCRSLRQEVCNYYFELYNIKPIEKIEKTILFNCKYEEETDNFECGTLDLRKTCTGSYEERKRQKELPNECKRIQIKFDIEALYEKYLWTSSSSSLNNLPSFICFEDLEKTKLQIYFSKPVQEIQSSLFINGQLMDLCNKIHLINKEISGVSPWIKTVQEAFMIIDNFKSSEPKDQEILYYMNQNENFITQEKEIFIRFLLKLIKLSSNSLKFVRIPLLTHFSTSIIKFLMSNVYKKSSITNNSEIIFEDLKYDGLIEIEKLLENFQKPYDNDVFNNIFCVLNIKELHKNQFNIAIEKYNNNLFIEICKKCIEIKSTVEEN